VYRKAFEAAMRVFELSKGLLKEGEYSFTDQIRRASRSVCSSLAEAWRKRRYQAVFVSKLSDAPDRGGRDASMARVRRLKCGYLAPDDGRTLYATYDNTLGTIVVVINHPTWVLR